MLYVAVQHLNICHILLTSGIIIIKIFVLKQSVNDNFMTQDDIGSKETQMAVTQKENITAS